MAKRRVNLYVDGEVYDRVQALCERLGRMTTPSAIANMALTQFDATMTPVFDKALAGDKDAAYQLLQSVGLNAIGELSTQLGTIHTEHAKSDAKARAT